MSDHYVENAPFLRMDNISVGYTIGNLFSDTSSLRISATMQNVFTITNYSGQDPEVVGGIDYNLYPRPKTFVLGLKDRKSTRLNSSHVAISYAVFCLKKKRQTTHKKL